MKTYIALLRGINVSGQKKIKMADLKEMFETLGFSSVVTYIQSGNVIFQSTDNDIISIGGLIKKGIIKQFGFDVPVLVITPETPTEVYENNPFLDKIEKGELEAKKMYFTLLASSPDPAAKKELNALDTVEEAFFITEKVVYFFATNGYGKTKLNNNFFEKKLQCEATTRNLKTMIKLLELSNL